MISILHTGALGKDIFILILQMPQSKLGGEKAGAGKVGGGQGLSACGVKCEPCLWQWLPACVSISQRSIMRCPHAETFNSMLINAGKQSLLCAPSTTSVPVFIVVSGYFSLFVFFLLRARRCCVIVDKRGILMKSNQPSATHRELVMRKIQLGSPLLFPI